MKFIPRVFPTTLSLGLVLFWTGGALFAATAIDIGSRKQLFIDHKLIESSEGVALTVNPPVRTGELLITADAPWEKNLRVASYSSVIVEDGLIRVWYNVLSDERKPRTSPSFMGLAYAESRDGVHFTKPILNLVEFEGSKANNLVLPGDPTQFSVAGGSVIRDDNPACPPEERYKTWTKVYPKAGVEMHGPSRIWVSPDGIRWKLTDRRVTGLRATDTQMSYFWEPRVGRYVAYSREWVQFAGERDIRMASYNESDDLFAWDKTQVVLQPDELDMAGSIRPLVVMEKMRVERERLKNFPAETAAAVDESAKDPFADRVPTTGAPVDIYGPGVMPYGDGSDRVYVALMMMFHHWHRGTGPDSQEYPDTGDVQLALSRDGRNFIRPGGRKPFLSVGPAGSFDSKWIWAMPGLVTMKDEIWIYYFGMNLDHFWRLDPDGPGIMAGISRAKLRVDGFVSADFDYAGGTILTPPLRFDGSRLELNVDTGAGGMGRVEILDEHGAPIPGFTLADADFINGNKVRTAVSWGGKTDLSALEGRTVRLRFKMRSAKFYAFQFRKE